MTGKTRSKGNRSVRRAVEYYTSLGYTVDKVEKTGRFIVEKDLFALTGAGFDLVAIKKNIVVFIQVKTNTPPSQQKYRTFAQTFGGTNLLIESYTWYDFKGAVIHHYLPDGSITKEDIRK